MHASNAKARLMGLADRARKRPFRRRLGLREFIRLPCLLPATVIIFLGLLAVGIGAGMSVIGYVPSYTSRNGTNSRQSNNTLISADLDPQYFTRKIYAYIGPIFMAVGIFAMITACVFYCEVLDKYTILVPDKRVGVFDKEELYNIIIGEMKKSYAQTLVTIYTKVAEQSLLMDSQSCSGEYPHEPVFPYKANEPLTLEQQIDIECEGYTPSPPVPNKRYSIIQARIQRLKSEDNWLKTSSLPNIRRSVSIRRASRIGPKITDSRTLSCDYTMDEARLRRKSMMLRTLVQWNSGSSDLFAQRQRRFSSAKALPSFHNDSFDDVSENGYGSFPLTRLIQRRGTLACGDMKTRRMKFLLLLEASESQEGFNDSVSVDGRHTVAAIRRNSFVPYTTCDKFIAGEERKTIRDRRRSSINPFSLRNRVSTVAPEPVIRRHSFYPIRRDTKIYNIDPNEHRRHSFNPIGINNTLKSEFVGKADGRRASFIPDSMQGRTEERRPSYIPQQSTRFLLVPGLDPYAEGRPIVTSSDLQDNPQHSVSDPGYSFSKPGGSYLQPQGFQDERRIDRRHSFNPVVWASAGKGDNLRLPQITINEDTSERFLTVPSQDYYIEERERRHSYNMPQSKPAPTTAASSKFNEKPNPQRISFKLEPSVPSAHLSPPSNQTVTKSTLKTSKSSTDPVRPSSFAQEMVVFRPLRQPISRSASPCSNASCCGSDKIGSDHSGAISRTASMCSDRSARTNFTVSPGPSESVSSFGPFQQYTPSSKHNRETSLVEDSKSTVSHTQQFLPSKLKTDSPLAATGSWYDVQRAQKSAFQYNRRRGRARHQHVDTPGSTNSGPAALSAGSKTDASTTIHRSKSASALAGFDINRPLSPRTTLSYARVPKPSSPLVTRHKVKSRQQADKRTS